MSAAGLIGPTCDGPPCTCGAGARRTGKGRLEADAVLEASFHEYQQGMGGEQLVAEFQRREWLTDTGQITDRGWEAVYRARGA